MWTTIYMVAGIEGAERIKLILKNEGFMVRVGDVLNDGKEDLYEISVPEIEAEDARELFIELNIY